MATKVSLGGVEYESDDEYGSEQLFSYLGRREEKREELRQWLIGGTVWCLVVGGLAFLMALPSSKSPEPVPAALQCITR